MTTPDIVERLRRDQYKECDCWRCVVCEDAADEIERLRAELSSAQSTIINLCDSVKSGGKFYSDFLVKFDELRARLALAERVVEAASEIINLGTRRRDGGIDYIGNVTHLDTALTAYRKETT